MKLSGIILLLLLSFGCASESKKPTGIPKEIKTEFNKEERKEISKLIAGVSGYEVRDFPSQPVLTLDEASQVISKTRLGGEYVTGAVEEEGWFCIFLSAGNSPIGGALIKKGTKQVYFFELSNPK